MSALVINPVEVTDAVLVYSSVAEDDYPPWSAPTDYALEARVIRPNHRIYENQLAGVNATAPEAAPDRWLDVGPTNRHAMFDNEVGSVTRVTGSISVTVRPGQIGGAGWLELEGVTDIYVTMKPQPGALPVYETVLNMEANDILDVYDWFFQPFEARTAAVLTDLPAYADCELTFTLVGAPTLGCGVCQFGAVHELGGTELGARVGLVSYSRKTKNQFGRYTFVPNEQRGFGLTFDITVVMPKAAFNRTLRLLTRLLDKPCIYVLDDGPGYEAAILFGIYLEWFMLIPDQEEVSLGLQVEGLI